MDTKVHMKDEKGWVEYLRFITPILITIALFMLGSIDRKVEDIDQKLFKHLTNDDIHTPKDIVVTRAEFNIYQNMREKQMCDLRDGLNSRIDGLRGSMDRVISLLDNKKR